MVVSYISCHCLLADIRVGSILLNTQRNSVSGITKRLDAFDDLTHWLHLIFNCRRTEFLFLKTMSFWSLLSLANPLTQIRKTHTLRLINFQALPDEILDLFWNGDSLPKLDRHTGHFVDEFAFSSALPRGLSMQHLIDHYTNRPNIVLYWVNVLLQCLRWHVQRTSHVVLLLLKRRTVLLQTYCDFFAKPKSAIFATPLLMKMLASLRSRWRNLFSPISRKPSTMSFMMLRTSVSLIRRLFLSRELRSPSLQNSVTI